jgi:amidase
MNRRGFMKVSLGSGVAAISAQTIPALAAVAPRAGTIVETSITQLQSAMQAGTLSSQSLTRMYLKRIAAIDKAGPRLNAVLELNPDALAIARALDQERKATGPRGPLHGIPVLLKDNIATADKMSNSAGSLALSGSHPVKDSFVAERLRAAGAVILGKTNLSEWANLRSTRSTSGWSGRGGLTLNPYALDRNTSGSSSGSASAVAASLAAAAVGTETNGSIVSPASICGLVGIKPTVGLVSRSGIIPLSHTQDTAGPMARSVTDAVLLLGGMTGIDPSDPATADGEKQPRDFSSYLKVDALRGARIGVVRNFFGGRRDLIDPVIKQALNVLRAQGAVLVDCEMPNVGKATGGLDVLLVEFKAGLENYLKTYAPDAPIKNMAELVAFNLQNEARELPYFGQEYLIRAAAKGDFNSQEYIDALAANRRFSRAEGIDQVMNEFKLDALVAPTNGTAWITDLINGDASGNSFAGPAAVAGYPHITVPAGQVHGLPVAISFVGRAWAEPTLIGLAYSYEQASKARRPPTYARSLSLRAKLV